MDSWKRRIAYALATVTTVVLVYAAGYQWAMAAFEHESVSYLQSVQVVVESITTAGFGGHAPWASTVMNVFVLGMNLTGVVFVFLAVPVFLVPLFREVLRTHPPSSTAKSDHIIVCNHSPRGRPSSPNSPRGGGLRAVAGHRERAHDGVYDARGRRGIKLRIAN